MSTEPTSGETAPPPGNARPVLVAPTGHGVGLTTVCLGLLHALEREGISVGFFKPLSQPHLDAHVDRSTALVRFATSLDPPDPIPSARVASAVGAGGLDLLMEDVVAAAEAAGRGHEVLIVEGLVPGPGLVYSGRVNQALAQALDADVVLVGAAGDQSPTTVAKSTEIAALPYRHGDRDRVLGVVINRAPEDWFPLDDDLRAELTSGEGPLAGVVPYRAELTWPRLRDVLADNVRVLASGETDRRVKGVVVAARSVPGVLPYLTEGQLVIVPGDRDDVLLAVSLAVMNGTRLAGLLVSGGLEPDPRVWAMCQPAIATGLPVLLSEELTYDTVARIHDSDPELPADDTERTGRAMDVVADALEPAWLETLRPDAGPVRLSPPAFRRRLVATAREADRLIVLPEGAEPRTVQAAVTCQNRGIARCLLLAPPEQVAATASGLGLVLPEGLRIIDPSATEDRHVNALAAARAHKGMTLDMARDQLGDPVMLGTVMLALDEVDGLVAGAVHTTAATLRPALQVLGTSAGARLVSSLFFMCLPDEVVIYGDCAVNPDPDAEGLADIAIQSAASARAFGIEPRVAMISFSTGSSGAGADVDKVAAATQLVRERAPHLAVDGPLQYDAAAVASVGRSKAPDSPVAGRATVFVFPDLNTGNTTYKAVQRNADVVSIGPMLQGLAKPVNDLSRGALVDDIVYTIALTAIQAARSES
jgi:phosphate acetyltransferase